MGVTFSHAMRKTILLKLTFLVTTFLIASYWVYWLALLLDLHNKNLPKTLSDLRLIISDLKSNHPNSATLLIFYSSIYLYEQAFCLPGCMLLNILGGSLYSTPTAIVLTSFLTAAGSTIAHSLSKISLVWMLSTLFRKRVKQVKQFYNAYSSTQSFAKNTRFVASMRMLPVMPGWTLNLTLPLIPNISVFSFFIGTFIGTVPYNAVVVSIGSSLNELDGADPLNHLFSIKFLL